MLAYLARRLAWSVPTLFGASVLAFLALHLAPGDPITALAARQGAGEAGLTLASDLDRAAHRRALERELGLDLPLWQQYLAFLGPLRPGPEGHAWLGGDGSRPYGGLLAGDLGRELLRPSVRVGEELRRRLAFTAPLVLASLVLAFLLALPLGILAAERRGGLFDRLSGLCLHALDSTPTFWGALLLALLFGARGLGLLPALGPESADAASLAPFARFADRLAHLVLPLAALTYGHLAWIARQARAGLIEAYDADATRFARAIGLPESALRKRVLRRALLPLLSIAGSMLPAAVAGSLVVETVFDLPGMGRYAFEGLSARDPRIVLALTTLVGLATVLATLAVDLAYAWADPRLGRRGAGAVRAREPLLEDGRSRA